MVSSEAAKMSVMTMSREANFAVSSSMPHKAHATVDLNLSADTAVPISTGHRAFMPLRHLSATFQGLTQATGHTATQFVNRALGRVPATLDVEALRGGGECLSGGAMVGAWIGGTLGGLAGLAVPLTFGILEVIPGAMPGAQPGAQNITTGVCLIVFSVTGLIPFGGALAGMAVGAAAGACIVAPCAATCARDF